MKKVKMFIVALLVALSMVAITAGNVGDPIEMCKRTGCETLGAGCTGVIVIKEEPIVY